MKISCPTCAAKYSVADEKIQSRLAKIRCRKCSSTIVIDGMTTPASVYIGDSGAPAAPGASQDPEPGEGLAARGASAGFSNPAPMPSEPVGPAADEYAVDIADNDQRNMTIHQIVGAYNEGLISADTYIWKEGMADWQTLAEVKAVADALHAAARPAPAPAAAVRRNDHGAAPDLFGRIASAGGEDDITTSAPQPSFSAGTGARNESSVLFSLSALTGSGEATAAPAGGGKRTRSGADDSGLIDLTALTASEASGAGGFGAPSGGFGASPLISAPLGGVSGPAIGAGLMPNYGAPRSSGRTLVVAASLLAVAIIGGAALFVVNRGGSEPEPTSSLEPAPSAAAAAKPAAREPEAEPIGQKPEPTEKETETASVKDSVSADELPTAAPEPAPKAPAARAPSAPRPRPAP
ncbi:MAG TPA: zinc-ribbon domain-containing protein, partial [Polyangiaceae bacterium]|nr:zinc-ribbon domain-containing protein [Polyangiaceae bacterium]